MCRLPTFNHISQLYYFDVFLAKKKSLTYFHVVWIFNKMLSIYFLPVLLNSIIYRDFNLTVGADPAQTLALDLRS